jgi:hypothetical protein
MELKTEFEGDDDRPFFFPCYLFQDMQSILLSILIKSTNHSRVLILTVTTSISYIFLVIHWKFLGNFFLYTSSTKISIKLSVESSLY